VVRALLASLMVVVLAACGSSAGSGSDTGAPVTNIQTSDDDGYRGILLEKPYAVPDLTLTDTAGKPFDLATQADRTLVFFGYTNCPDICQIVMSTIASAVAKLSKDEQARLQVVFVTTDPSRDTRSVLRSYLDRFNPDFVGVTSSLEKIKALGKPLAIDIEHGQKLPSGGYEVSHGTSVVSVHAGAGDLLWTAATSPSDMAADLHKILKADS
jgi:protein SCO1/2